MDDFLHMRTFVTVARAQGFSEAARQLGVVPSVVAKRIAQLETSLGGRLFERTTRSVRLTEAGERLYARAGALVADFDELMSSVERDDAKLLGHLRVAVPTSLTVASLGGLLSEFLAHHEGITMDIELRDDALNPADQGFDLALSGRTASYEGVAEVPLCPTSVVVCASPAYLARRGAPEHPADLVRHDCLAFRPSGLSWRFQGARGVVHLDVAPRLVADDNLTLLRAALCGLGIAMLPRYIAGTPVDDGRLVALLPEHRPPDTWFKMYVPKRRMHVARVRALVAFLNRRMGDERWLEGIRLPA